MDNAMIQKYKFARPCIRCDLPQEQHAGDTHQGACPQDSGKLFEEILRGQLPRPYAQRMWKPAPWGLPGSGPWVIDPECEAPKHNSITAAEGRDRTGIRCCCPRANALRVRRNSGRDRKPPKKPSEYRHIPAPKKVTVVQPDLSAGACRPPVAAMVFDRAFDSSMAYREARSICDACPLRDRACFSYVKEAEQPPGSWGGVWAGMSPGQRVKAFS
jgi:hypothetical protein